MFRHYVRQVGPRWMQAAGVAALAYLAFVLIARYALPWLTHQPQRGIAPSLNIKSLLRQVNAAVKEGSHFSVTVGVVAFNNDRRFLELGGRIFRCGSEYRAGRSGHDGDADEYERTMGLTHGLLPLGSCHGFSITSSAAHAA